MINAEIVATARDVALVYPGTPAVQALDGISLDLMAGSSLAITGRSGSGKSSLISVLSLLRQPTSGTITVNGVETSACSGAELANIRRRSIGVVFQSFHLEHGLTAADNVMLPWFVGSERRPTLREGRTRAEDLLDQVGIGELADRRPGQMSGGQRQRVALARALFTQPSLLVADEPTGNLDEETADAIARLLMSLPAQCSTSVVVVTHDQTIARLADRTATIAHGRLALEVAA